MPKNTAPYKFPFIDFKQTIDTSLHIELFYIYTMCK